MKALVINNSVMDVEKRDINVYDYYHKDIAKLFLDCPDDVEIGYLYKDGEFIKPEVSEVEG